MNTINNHLPGKFDTIVIGSGVGGLSTAICLAKTGQKVLVLEQHDVPGGWCHSFYLNGHRFTPGVHYIGLLGEGESTSELYKGLGIANDLTFFKMNKDGYEHCLIGEERFDYPAGFDNLIQKLAERFPEEKDEIKKYINLVQDVSRELYLAPEIKGFWQKFTIPYRTRHMGKYGLFSLRRVLNWHVKNPLLKRILTIQCGDHGLQPRKVRFLLHCAVASHYSNGGYYPMGGGGALVKAMTNALKRQGGIIRTSETVTRILLDDQHKKRAVGVELQSGQKIYANTIVSNADPGITFHALVGKENLSKALSNKLSKTAYSCTSLMLFLTVDMDLRQAGMDSGNIWVMPNEDSDEVYDRMMSVDIHSGDSFEAMFISCTTLKDPASFDGKFHTIEAISYINYEGFAKFSQEVAKRSQGYLDFKAKLIKKMLQGLEKIVPGISQHIVQMELGTPITNKYYVRTTNGNVYGTEKSLRNIGPFAYKSKTEIENLYMCGASIHSHGVAGASHSGVHTAAEILGCHKEELLVPETAQDLKIYDAENDADYPDWMLQKMKVRRARLASKGTATVNQ